MMSQAEWRSCDEVLGWPGSQVGYLCHPILSQMFVEAVCMSKCFGFIQLWS